MEHASKILAHFFTPRCIHRIFDGDHSGAFVCRKPKKLKIIHDNTKHSFIKFPMNLTYECKYILVDIQLKEESNLNTFRFEGEHIFNNNLFNPNRHVPITNPTHDLNIYPVIGEIFAATKK